MNNDQHTKPQHMDVLCTFKIKIESQNLKQGYIKDKWYIQIKINMPNPIQEPPVSSKPPNEDLEDIYVLSTFKSR